jgi:hypothetical protein
VVAQRGGLLIGGGSARWADRQVVAQWGGLMGRWLSKVG